MAEAYSQHLVEHGESFFCGQLSEAQEFDDKGEQLCLSPAELDDNIDELLRLCHKLWLEGKTDFDYRLCETEEWDDRKLIDQDSEDKWFDGEAQESAHCTDTGVQDF